MHRRTLRRFVRLACLTTFVACIDWRDPAAPSAPPPAPDPVAPGGRMLYCTATTGAPDVRCDASPTIGVDARGAIILGGQGQYVQLTSSQPPSYDGAQFTFAVTVQNLIPQALGTTDGATPHADGVRVFFHSGPTATSGSGVITVSGDGTDTFLSSARPFYKYAGSAGPGSLGGDGILSPNETSVAKPWTLNVPNTVQTFAFTLYVAAEVRFPQGYVDVSPAADTVIAGGTRPHSATVRTAAGNPVPGQTVTWGSNDTGIATIDGSGTVTAVGPGSATITATSGARTGAGTVAVCPSLGVGQVYVADMPAGASFCLAGGASGAEYVVVPTNTAAASAVSLSVTGSGIVAPTGPPTPRIMPDDELSRLVRQSRLDEHAAFHREMRRREQVELGYRAPASGHAAELLPPGPGLAPGEVLHAITPGVPAVGALMSLNVRTSDLCSTADTRTGRVMAVGSHAIIMADTVNPSGGFTAGDYASFADSLDAFIYPTLTANFGSPGDIDSNGRVVAFFTRAVNERTPPGQPHGSGGFFVSRDLRPAASCPTSNVGEMLYLLAADPAGTVTTPVTTAQATRLALSTMAHELGHLINASRRLKDNQNAMLEEPWLDEALAQVGEELVFYDRSGLAPGQNLGAAAAGDAFFQYMFAPFGRLRQWLLSPHTNGPFQQDGDAATTGAAWAFLRYAADRRGGTQATFWNALAGGPATGMANLQVALGTDPRPWVRDFTAAMYADDAGIGASAPYTQPSWNFRQIYANLDYDPGAACSCAYELAVRNLANGVADAFTLSNGGGTAYVRLGVSANAFAGVTLRSGATTPPSTVRLTVIRRK